MRRKAVENTRPICEPEVAAAQSEEIELRNPEFYALVAQVLPTLLIAVVLELRAIAEIAASRFVSLAKDARAMHEAGLLSPSVRQTKQTLQPFLRAKRFWRRWIGVWIFTGVAFLIAEVSSLAVVYFGPDTWITWIAAPSSGLSAVSLVILAVAAPFRTFTQTLRGPGTLDADAHLNPSADPTQA